MGRSTRAKPPKIIKITERELKKIKKQISEEATQIASVLMMAVMVQNHNLTGDQICEDMEDTARWAQYLALHILQIKEVVEYVEEKSDMELEYAKKLIERLS